MDYINPFGAMSPVDSSIESPFLRDMARGTRDNLAMPFIEMAKQRQQLEFQARGAELSEKFSPLATQSRQTGYERDIETNRQTVRALPWKTDQEISDAKHKILMNPAMTQQKIAEAEQAAIKARGTPAANFFNELASINTEIKKLPEQARPLAAQHYIEQFKARHPGAKLPAIMQQYDPVHWDLAELVAVNTAEHQRKMKEQESKESAHMQRTEKEIAGRERVAEIGAEGRVNAVTARGDGSNRPPKTDQEAFQRGQIVLSNPEATPEQKAEAAKMMQNWIRKRAEDFLKTDPLSFKDKTLLPKKIKEYEDMYGVTEALSGTKTTTPTQSPPKSVRIGGQEMPVSKIDPDGTLWVRDPATGRERPIKPKGK